MSQRTKHPYLPDSEVEIRMRWLISSPPAPVPQVPEGYVLRVVRPDEKQALEELFSLAWPQEYTFEELYSFCLPDGFFVVEELATGFLVSASLALKPGVFKDYSHVGTLGWLVTDPAHGGRGLATTVVLAVMNRLAAEGYEESYLGTEDERLAAIHIYLKLGWKPLLYTDGMEERWHVIEEALDTR
jgi:mycothiol synthase